MSSMITVQVDITGIVQGVGFRPFLFNLAVTHGLKGWILNRGNAGVRMEIQGEKEDIEAFLKDIDHEKPAISRIDDVSVVKLEITRHYQDLKIKESEEGRGETIVLPADIATCNACLSEMMGHGTQEKSSRYFMYPFIACAHCGPRFTTVVDLPYDRRVTTMTQFPLCNDCLKEYRDKGDRRFHAQTFACPECGPHYWIEDAGGVTIGERSKAFSMASDKLTKGKIIAMKGIGGVHLVWDAMNEETTKIVRQRKKNRKTKPFAIMVRNISMAREYAHVSSFDESILKSHRRPIVILLKKLGTDLAHGIAPGLNSIGMMLPYMGSHHVLLEYITSAGLGPLVFTSGNTSGIPMAITIDDIKNQLGEIADYFLLHNRDIYQRCDDSVGKTCGNDFLLIRRSRGYVPEFLISPVNIGKDKVIIACGAELHSNAAILKRDKIFTTQYIGDVSNLETLEYLDQSINHFKKLLRIDDEEIATVCCDQHPSFLSTNYAKELGNELNVPLTPVYHHHSHSAALHIDNRLPVNQSMIYITLDGVGYGSDGNAWGGEIFAGTIDNLQRVAHLKYLKMPGGDLAVKYPARMLASILSEQMDPGMLESSFQRLGKISLPGKEAESNLVIKQLNENHRMPITSSMGRILDATSVALGACSRASYDGEPAIRLEGLAESARKTDEKLIDSYIQSFSLNNHGIIDFTRGIMHIVNDNLSGEKKASRAVHARAFLLAVGRFFAGIAINEAMERGIDKIGMSGGVFLNRYIFTELKRMVNNSRIKCLHHSTLPPGDGCIAPGQAIIGAMRFLQES
ncbi:carbamoyltransferase HypF [Candidatus Bathyarchaeota archaeon]|nr:carbamoyltransferase HypF [Candidatus Bathyarchaeota archaeon]